MVVDTLSSRRILGRQPNDNRRFQTIGRNVRRSLGATTKANGIAPAPIIQVGGLARNWWTPEIGGIILPGGSDVQEETTFIYKRAEG